jgi:hypothetical protein
MGEWSVTYIYNILYMGCLGMADSRSGEGWTVEVDENVIIWEFLPDMDLSSFKEDAYPVFEELIDTHDLDAMVTVVNVADPFNADTFDVWEQSAQRAETAGIERWGLVAEGVKAISLRGKIDTGSLETLTSENRTEVVEWAHSAD